MISNKNIRTDKLPDHISSCKHSPVYSANANQIGIKFKGEVRQDVIEYCVSKGYVRTAVYKNGKPKLERGKIVTLIRFGVVEPYWK